jgi:hypothetical protein
MTDTTKQTRRACIDVVGHARQGRLMSNIVAWLDKTQYLAPWHDNRAWIAESYAGWAKRESYADDPITARQMEHWIVDLAKQGWLLKSCHRSTFHDDKTTLHVAPSDAFFAELEKYTKLGREEYFKQRHAARVKAAKKAA